MTTKDIVEFIRDAKQELTINGIGRAIQEALEPGELNLLIETLNS